MFDYEKIHNEVEAYLEGWYQYYDVPGIMDSLRLYTTEDGGCISSIDDVDSYDFTEILEQHEK